MDRAEWGCFRGRQDGGCMRRYEGEARRRTISEARILDILMMHGLRFEAAKGDHDAAARVARAALEQGVANGLPYRQDPGRERDFDPVEMLNFMIDTDSARFWTGHCMESGRREVWLHVPGGPHPTRTPPPFAPHPQRYRLSLKRRYNLARRVPGERIRLGLPLPLEDHDLRDLELEQAESSCRADTPIRLTPGRLDAVLPVPDEREVSLGWRAAFTALTPDNRATTPLSSADRELYVRPSEGLIQVSARVRALATDLAGSGPALDPMTLARRFWDFIMNELACGAIHYDRLDVKSPLDTVLDTGWCDCRAGSALMVALCRARGLPARLVSGYLLHETAPSFHTWLEVWMEGRGWAPFDLIGWGLSGGGRDAAWRDHYFGRIDHRMALERPPRAVAGPGSVRLPPRWVLLTALTDRGARATFEDADTGEWIFQEDVEVARLTPDKANAHP